MKLWWPFRKELEEKKEMEQTFNAVYENLRATLQEHNTKLIQLREANRRAQ